MLEECGDIAMSMLQNKVDLIDKAVVSSEEAEAMARSLNLCFYRACVKEDLNVSSGKTFRNSPHVTLASSIYSNHMPLEIPHQQNSRRERASFPGARSVHVFGRAPCKEGREEARQ